MAASFALAPDFDATLPINSGSRRRRDRGAAQAAASTLFNCNDAKLFGTAAQADSGADFPAKSTFCCAATRAHGPHSILRRELRATARAISHRVRATRPTNSCGAALHVGARYAIPFASNHCFLHRETIGFNGTATTPDEVRRHYREVAAGVGSRTECMVMPPGSSWSDQEGFRIQPFDFAARGAYIDSMLSRHGESSRRAMRRKSVRRRFRLLPRLLRADDGGDPALHPAARLRPLVFEVREASGKRFWRVDPVLATVEELPAVPADNVIIEVHAAVLRDCTRNRMFSVWSASKRLRIKLPAAEALAVATRWLTLLDLYELDTFPLARNFSPRSLAVRLRRWREPVEVASLLLRRALLRRPTTIAALYPVKAV